MQPRLIIAAAFFLIGAIIAIPALSDAATPVRPGRTMPVNAPAATLAPTASPTASPTTSPTARPSASPTRTPKPTPSPSRTLTPTPTPRPPKPPAIPIKAQASKVDCPSGKVKITVTSKSQRTEDYSVTIDEATVLADRVAPGGTRETNVSIEENKTSTVKVVWGDRAAMSVKRKADCVGKTAKPDDAKALPRTGPDDGDLFAKVATGVAAMITGVVIFWYGSIWPRRRTRELGSKG